MELRSYGLAGVCQAITNLDNAYPNPAPKLILFMTSGIQQNIGGCLAEDVINKSRTGEIWVHTIFMGSEATTGLDQISEGTQAEFIRFNSIADLNPLYSQIGLLRQQYQLAFRSQVSSSSERTLQVSINPESSSAPVDSFSFTVQPSPQAPTVTGIVVNEGSPILRTAPDSDSKTDDVTPNQVPVTASVTWSDGYPRVLQNARIEVDGVPLGDMIVGEDGSLSFTWDIRGYFTPGTNTARIKIIARDELGMEGASELDIPIEVTIPSALDNAFCLEAQKVPAIGDWLYATCIKL